MSGFRVILENIYLNIHLFILFQSDFILVVHTPAEWTPKHIYKMTKQIKMLNKSAGLDTFVVLMGTGNSRRFAPPPLRYSFHQ